MYFILLWKIPHKWPKKARYHDAVHEKSYFFFLEITHHLALSCIVLHHLALSCIILHHLASSCIVLRHLALPCVILHCLASCCIILHTETSRNTTNVEDICLPIPNILQTFSVHIRILMFKKAQYHDAVYDTCISFYSGNSHINGPKEFGTMMPCMTYAISFYFGNNT